MTTNNSSGEKLLAGQAAIVTASSCGIGTGIAIELGAAGAKVVVNYAGNREGADAVIGRITEGGGKAIAVKADVSREDEVVAMFGEATDTYGTVDILISNAGVQKDAAFVDMTFEQWHRVIGTNLTGAFLCAREAAREFLRRGMVPERSRALGKIIFISSVHEIIPWAGHVNYAASKGGVMLLMKSMPKSLAPKRSGPTVSPRAPSKPRSIGPPGATAEAEADLLTLIPYKRVANRSTSPGRRPGSLPRRRITCTAQLFWLTAA